MSRDGGRALSVFAIDAADRGRPALYTDAFTWSFEDVAQRALALLDRLRSKGNPIDRGQRVALRAAGTPEVFLAIHALAGIGATLVPIHPRLTPAEVRVLLDVTRPDRVLDDRELLLEDEGAPATHPTAHPGAESAPRTPRGIRAGDHAPPPKIEAPDPRDACDSSDVAAPFVIVATSGTTGTPKGAVISRRAVIASAEASARNLGWRDDDRWLLCMPLAHVGGLSIVTRCLLARRAVVMAPRFEPRLVIEAIRRHSVTLVSVVPTMLDALLDADREGALERPRAILLGGAAAPPALLDRCAERGVRALTTYGLTEACSQVTSQAPRDPSIREDGSGAALDGFEVRIAGPAGDEALPPGNVGRIVIGGAAMFDGYLRAESSTIDRAPLASGLFDTGDLGEIDAQGRLHVHARRTDLVVTGGENVYPVEVEHAIERLPGVRRAAVFGAPDARWGQIVAAAIEVDPSSPPDPAATIEALHAALAPHKRPRKWAFVEHLPLTSSGKPIRAGLFDRFAPQLADVPRPGAPR